MYTYNDEPILDVSNLFSSETMSELDREIMIGLYDHSFKDVGIAEKELESWEIEAMRSMSYAE